MTMSKGQWVRKMGPGWGKTNCNRCGKTTTKGAATMILDVFIWDDGRPCYEGRACSLQQCPECAAVPLKSGDVWEIRQPWTCGDTAGVRVIKYQKK